MLIEVAQNFSCGYVASWFGEGMLSKTNDNEVCRNRCNGLNFSVGEWVDVVVVNIMAIVLLYCVSFLITSLQCAIASFILA